jgi:pimeloyl-ACP methyl ester carboxylesterase
MPFDGPTLDAFLAYIADEVVSGAPLIVGYSLGGYVAMRYACALPDRTSGLLLTGSTANIVGVRRALYASAVCVTAHIPPLVIQTMLGAFFRVALPPRVANVVIPFRFNHAVFEQGLRLAGDVRYSDLLAGYRKPVLLVNGKWDLLFRCDERAFARAAGARLVIMPRTDHVAPLRQPGEFSAIVREFARGLFASQIHTEGRTAQGRGG